VKSLGVLLLLVGWWPVVSDCDWQHMRLHSGGVVWQRADPSENAHVISTANREGESGLVVSGLIGELIVNASVQDDQPVSFQRVPFSLRERGIIVDSEAAIRDCLSSEDCLTAPVWVVPVIVANVIFDGVSARSANPQRCGASFVLHKESGEMACIRGCDLEWQDISPICQDDSPGDFNFCCVNPRALLGLHLSQLSSNGLVSVVQSGPLQSADANHRNGESGNGPSSAGRTPGRAISGVLFLSIGAALLKIALRIGEDPDKPVALTVGNWGLGAVAGILIVQGTILTLSGQSLLDIWPYASV